MDPAPTPTPAPNPEPEVVPDIPELPEGKKELDYRDFDLPEYKRSSERRLQYWWADGESNVSMLEQACDYNFPYTKIFANYLSKESPGEYNLGQVCAIFDYCYSNWSYVNDPKGQEYVAKASESIGASLAGDCDDFAVVIASCIIAIGGRAAITSARNAKDEGHAYAEVDITQFGEMRALKEIKARYPKRNISSIGVRRSGSTVWMNLDWQANYPGGPYWSSIKRDYYEWDNGTWYWRR